MCSSVNIIPVHTPAMFRYPFLQLHWKLPGVFIHMEFKGQSSSLRAHSSISTDTIVFGSS